MEAVLLQYLLQKGCRTLRQTSEFLRTTGNDVTDDRVEDIRVRINRELEFADIELRRMTSPFDGNVYVALVNKQRDDIVTEMLAKKHPSPRPEFFKRLMTVLLQNGDEVESGGCLSEPDALRIGRGTCPGFDTPMELSAQECTSALVSLLKDGWIVHHPLRPGHYALGVRALLEFHDEILNMDLPESMRTLLEQHL